MANKYDLNLVARFSTDLSKLNTDVGKIQKAFSQLDLGEATNNELKTLTNDLAKEIGKFQNKVQQGFNTRSDLTSFEKTASKVTSLYKQLEAEINKIDNDTLKDLLPKNASEQFNKVTTAFKKFSAAQMDAAKNSTKLKKEVEKTDNALASARERVGKKAQAVKDIYAALQQPTPADAKKALDALESEIEKHEADLRARVAKGQAAGTVNMTNKGRVARSSEDQSVYNDQLKLDSMRKQQQALKELASAQDKERQAAENNTAAKNEQTASSQNVKTAFKELAIAMAEAKGKDTNGSFEMTDKAIEDLIRDVQELSEDKLKKLAQSLPTGELKTMGTTLDQVEKEVEQTASDFDVLASKDQDMKQFKSSLMSFFSVTNVIQLFKRTLREAFNSVKELDKAMTETAVVTDFSVSDMWEQLPRYTELANELGVTTLGAYETMTLFYQQGLKTNEVFEIGTETMKMARIGGMEYEDATNKMTAALRGFNMELDTLSAQNVSDVYSELAAITAADTDEISTAMTKTASIAHSAGMEFETTSAFLAQIIETTREAPETAGTALKTIIARFQALSKDPNGVTVFDGETVDANKIDEALKSVGISIMDAYGQFRNLDEVFLELSSKWDTLDKNTQRYIATISAGSRQQSRFIAMMDNYDRTLELVNAAYNSTGSSQRQYEKTLESLQSKLDRLDNSWNTFMLGITNSGAIKFGVDLLNVFLKIVNTLTEGVGGLSTTILRLGVAIGGLKIGKALVYGLGSAFLPGAEMATSFASSFKKTLANEFSGKGLKKVGAAFIQGYNQVMPKDLVGPMLAETQSKLIHSSSLIESSALAAKATQLDKTQALFKKASLQQQVAFNAALKNGIPIKQADILLTQADTKATLTQLLADSKLTDEQKKQILAEYAEQTVLKKGIGAKILDSIHTWAQTHAKSKNVVVTWLATAAEKLYTKAIKSKTAAMIISLGVIGLIIIAVAGLIALAAVLIKQAKDKTVESRLKRTNESIASLQEELEKTKESVQELEDSFKGLTDQADKISKLVQGTTAWKKAVAEMNSEVLALVEKYPELEKFINYDSELGHLVISEAGQNFIVNQQTDKMMAKNRMLTIQQIHARDLENEQALNKVTYGDFTGTGNSFQRVELSEGAANQIFEAYKASNGGLFGGVETGADLIARMKELGVSTDALDRTSLDILLANENSAEAIYSLMTTMQTNEEATKQLTAAMLAQDLSSKDGYPDSEYKAVIDAAVNNMDKSGSFLNEKYEDAKKIYSDVFGDDFKDAALKEVQTAYGQDAKITSTNTETGELTITYGKGDDAKTETISIEKMQDTLARAHVVENLDIDEVEREIEGRIGLITTRLGPAAASWGAEKSKTVATSALITEQGLDDQDYSNGYEKGNDFVDGYNNALTDGGTSTYNAAQTLPANAAQGVADKQQSNSPSKVGEGLGNDFGDGYVIGVDETQDDAGQSGADLANATIGSVLESQDDGAQQALQDFLKIYFGEQNQGFKPDVSQSDIDYYSSYDNDAQDFINYLNEQEKQKTKEALAALDANDSYSLEEWLAWYNEELQKNQDKILTTFDVNDTYSDNSFEKWLQAKNEQEEWEDQNNARQGQGFISAANSTEMASLTEQALYELYGTDTSKTVIDDALAIKRKTAFNANQTFLSGIEQKEADQITELTKAGDDPNAEAGVIGTTAFDKAVAESAKNIEETVGWFEDIDEFAEDITRQTLYQKIYFDRINKILQDQEEALNNVGSAEYFAVLEDIVDEAKHVFGEDLTVDFLHQNNGQNLQLLKDALAGDQNAFVELNQQLATLSFERVRQEAAEFTGELDGIWSWMQDNNGFQLTAGMRLEGSDQYIEQLNDVLKLTSASASEITSMMEKLGWDVITEEIEVEDKDNPIAEYNRNGQFEGYTFKKKKITVIKDMVAKGDSTSYTPSASTSSGGGGSDKQYEADYDKHYNKMEDLAEEQRIRNDLEEEYNKLLRDNNTTISDITKNINAQIDSLKREREIQEFLYDARRQQIRDTMSEYSDLQGYASYNFVDNTIEIDYDAIRAITDEEVGSRIDEYISKLEEFQDQMDEANDALAEIEEKIIEALEKGKEEYFNLEERAMEALVHSYEQEIDELNRINDSINDANSELLNSINSTLERQRREEENAEKEQELSDMQRRLDYLRQDTSGANALEIKQLEKELAEAQDDYTDSLIDQKISELEEQNDKAAEQRERQIAFAEAQLEAAQKTGALWDEIHKMFDTDIDENGIKTDSKLLQLLMAAEEVPSKSDLERNQWLADLHKEVVQGFSWLKDKNDVSDLITTGELSEGQKIKFTDAKGQEYNGIVNKDGSVTANDAIFRNVKRDQYGNYSTTESYDDAKRKAQSHNWQEQTPAANDTPVLTEDIKRGVSAAIWNGNYGWGEGDTRSANLREVFGENDIQENYVNDYVQSGYSGSLSDYSYTAMRLKFKKYKTGGLADFTGPAWLDGTKSRPELVLNQRDTQNFIQLRNVLAEATKSGFGKSENNEAVMFDIDINIDKVENEENVDALLTELERRINSYASYRNVTALTLKR